MNSESFSPNLTISSIEPSDDILQEAASRFQNAQEAPMSAAIMPDLAAGSDETPEEVMMPATAVIDAVMREAGAVTEEQKEARRELIPNDDPLGLERIINASDLMPINYLEKGLTVAKSVARVVIRNNFQQVLGFGTGFMVSPCLLMTNNHVLKDFDMAKNCMLEFRVEYDMNGRPVTPIVFEPDAERFFYTNAKLDFTIIAVKPTALDGTPLSQFGFNQLITASGKALPNEFVSIIQHPQGMPKQVTVRENKVLPFSGDASEAAHFIHYQTDTQPGSSGSPVFNDQWLVVALHHSGVPQMENGQPKRNERGEVIWIGNEGVRISSICEDLKANRDAINNYHLAEQMMTLGSGPIVWGASAPVAGGQVNEDYSVETLEAISYTGTGYDSGFLGVDVPLPGLTARQEQDAAKLKDGSGHILNYTNFSVIVNGKRRLAYFSACNIDGEHHISIPRTKDVWYVDGRISKDEQSADIHYRDGRLGVDRGHITRREEPNWGPNAELGNRDTFHFTNCSPQFWEFNQQSWLALENYVLETAKKNKLRVTVITGPVLRPDDRPYRGLLVPADFWKVVVWKSGDTLKSAAYLHSQRNFLDELKEAYGTYKTYQRTVQFIQELTDLDLSHLVPYDINTDESAVEFMEAARPSFKVIESEADLHGLLS